MSSWVVFVVGVAVACGGRSARFDGDDGATMSGSGGHGAGATAAGGSAGGAGASGGGAGSTAAAGASGVAASAGADGCSSPFPEPLECWGVPLLMPFITDFADHYDHGLIERWGGDPQLHLTGGTFEYGFEPGAVRGNPSPTDRSWRLYGTTADRAGFGIWFDARVFGGDSCDRNCLDATALGCEGVRFTISGSVSDAAPHVDVVLESWSNTYYQGVRLGGCVATVETVDSSCIQPSFRLMLPATRTEVRIAFEEFSGGVPVERGDGAELRGIRFDLPWSVGMSPYEFDITVSDFAFTGGPECTPPPVPDLAEQ